MKDSDMRAAGTKYFASAKALLPLGFTALDLLRHRPASNYERKLEFIYRQLGFEGESGAMLRAHLALKIVLAAGCLAAGAAIIAAAGFGPETAIFAAGLPVAVSYVQDRRVGDEVRKRRESISLEFPVFLNKLVLLCGAGMNLLPAVMKIYGDKRSETPLYAELGRVLREISAGASYTEAFEGLSARCGTMEVNSFVSLLVQNLRKGNDSLIPAFRLLTESCWDKRRNAARKAGEEMSTKLIFPTMLVFIAVLIIIMTPAFMQMSSI